MYGDPDKYFVGHGDFVSKAEPQRVLVRKIRERTGRVDPSILDIGAGRGELLEAGRRRGPVTRRRAGAVSRDGRVRRFVRARDVRDERRALRVDATGGPSMRLSSQQWPNTWKTRFVDACGWCSGAARRRPLTDVPREPKRSSRRQPTARTTAAKPGGVLNHPPTFPRYHVYRFNPNALTALRGKHGCELEDLEVWRRRSCRPRTHGPTTSQHVL